MINNLYSCYLVLFLLFFSCYEEEEFVDLSTYDDYVIRVTLYFDEEISDNDSECKIREYRTNSFGDVFLYYSELITRSADNETEVVRMFYGIKDYKKVGVKINNNENCVAYYKFELIESYSYVDWIFTEAEAEGVLTNKISIFYDFETDKLTVE